MSARSYEEVLGEVAELDAFIRIMAALDGPVDQVEVGRWLDRCVVLDTELARMAAEYTPGRFQKGMTIASAALAWRGQLVLSLSRWLARRPDRRAGYCSQWAQRNWCSMTTRENNGS